MTTEENTEMIKRIESMTTVNFTINGVPLDVMKEFKRYAKENTADSYWVAIKELLAKSRINTKDELLIDKIKSIEQRVATLEKMFEVKDEPVKTFGMKRGKKDE